MTLAAARGPLRTALLAVPAMTGVSVAWEGRPYTPTIGTRYVRETLKGVAAPLTTLGGDGLVLESFLYLLDVFQPAGDGIMAAETLADALRSAFRAGTSISVGSNFAQVEQADRGGALAEPNWLQVPVTLRMRLYRRNT